MTPLSNRQKSDIAQAARAAWRAVPDREALEAVNPDLSPSELFTCWRRVEQGKACGLQSLRAATQAHYGRLMAHFLALGGHAAAAARTLGRDADNARRVARYKLDQALRERGLQVGYAVAICRTQFRCALDEASEKQLWKLVYTIRSRRKPAPKPEVPDDGNPF